MGPVVAVVALFLSGCASDPPAWSPGCDAVNIPPLTQGSRATFDAEGTWLDGVDHLRVVDWRTDNASPDRGRGLFSLPAGSSLEVSIDEAEMKRFVAEGTPAPMIAASLAARTPEAGGLLTFRTEWLRADNASIEVVDSLARLVTPNGSMHLTTFENRGRPALFGTTAFAGRTVHAGEQSRFSWEPAMGLVSAVHAGFREGMSYVVSTVETPGGECVARVEGEWRLWDTRERAYPFTLVFGNHSAFPLLYSVHLPPSTEASVGKGIRLVLRDETPGTGSPLPPLLPVSGPWGPRDTTLVLAPTQQGFPATEDEMPFPTTFADAVQAARDSRGAGRWLGDHPDAAPRTARHVLGEGGTDVIDEWLIEWASPEERQSIQTRITLRDISFPMSLIEPRHEVWASEVEFQAFSESRDAWVTFDSMRHIHKVIYGAEPEIVECDFTLLECRLGRHNETGKARAGPVSLSGIVGRGVSFRIDLGILVVEESTSSRALEPVSTQ